MWLVDVVVMAARKRRSSGECSEAGNKRMKTVSEVYVCMAQCSDQFTNIKSSLEGSDGSRGGAGGEGASGSRGSLDRVRCGREFFDRHCVDLARAMLGCVLVFCEGGEECRGEVVEVEAYLGGKDKAAHSYNGRRSKANEAMYMVSALQLLSIR